MSSATVSQELVHSELRGEVGILTLDNYAKRNALSRELLSGLVDGLQGFSGKVRAVILRAEPDVKVWSAGHDVTELARDKSDPLAYGDPLEVALRAIRNFPAPVIAMVQGSVWGGAFDLVMSCDVVIADETASFAITPANLGLPYNTAGLLHFIGRLPLNLIKEMFFTAAPIKAQDSARWGIVNHLVSSADIDNLTFARAQEICTKAPLAIAVVKEQLTVLSDYEPIAAQISEHIEDLRRKVYDSEDFQEGINAFLQKRRPSFQGK